MKSITMTNMQLQLTRHETRDKKPIILHYKTNLAFNVQIYISVIHMQFTW